MKAYESLADLALGPAAGLVVENVPCFVCTSCNHLQFPDNGRALRDQIARWAQDPHRSHKTEPSLRYLSDAHPRNLQIEVSTRCNLFCAYCSHKALKAQTNMDALTFDKVMNAVDFNEIDYVDITGLGEATMNEDLPKIIEHIKQRAPHAEIGLVSNAVSASVGKWERLIEAGLTSISFSIDTLDAERFSHQRGGGSLKKAMRTVEGVAKLRSTLKRRLALRLKAVLIDEPYADAEALQDWSLRIGLDKPQFSTLDLRESAMKNYCGTDIERKAIDSAFDGSAFEQKLDQRWRRLGGLAPEKIMPGRYRHPALRIDKSLCHWAINAAFVTVDGDLLSCCESMTDLPRSIMGSLRNQQMTDAWREDLFWSYRLPLSLGMLPSGCVGCGYAPTYGQPM